MEPDKRMNCFKLLRHPFITGKTKIYLDITMMTDQRKNKKILSTIQEKEREESLLLGSNKLNPIRVENSNNFSLEIIEQNLTVSQIVESEVQIKSKKDDFCKKLKKYFSYYFLVINIPDITNSIKLMQKSIINDDDLTSFNDLENQNKFVLYAIKALPIPKNNLSNC